MQENNFEKQVQQKMEELKIKPSAEVWQKVAVNISKEKRDRKILAWFFILFLFIGSAIFITRNQKAGPKNEPFISGNIISTNTNKVPQNIAEQKPKQKEEPLNNSNNSSLKSFDTARRKQNVYQVEREKKNQPTHTPIKEIAVAFGENSEPGNFNTVDPKDAKVGIRGKANRDNKKTEGKLTTLIDAGISGNFENEKVDPPGAKKTNGEDLIPGSGETVITKQLVQPAAKYNTEMKEQVIDTIVAAGVKKEVALGRPIQTKQISKWKLGITVSLGIAATQKGYLGIIGTGNGGGRKAYFDMSQISGSNSGQSANTVHTPSSIQPGAGLVLGVFVQMAISPKTKLNLGLNYALYSSSIMIGNKVDSSIIYSANSTRLSNFYYSSGNSTSYKNYFHFIELPVGLQFKLSKQNKLPVYLNTGVSIAQLLGSNALQFESQTGAYYSNNSLWNKTQVNLSAGLLFALSRQAKNPFLIGPDIKYSVSKMANSGLFKDGHYSYFGVLLQKRLGDK